MTVSFSDPQRKAVQIQPSVKTCEGSEPFPVCELTRQPAQIMCVHGDKMVYHFQLQLPPVAQTTPKPQLPWGNSKGLSLCSCW